MHTLNETEKEFYDIITQVRTHLELQRALGLTVIEVPAAIRSSFESAAPSVPSSRPAASTKAHPEKKPAEQPKQGPAPAADDVKDCVQCRRSKGRQAFVSGEGNPSARIVFIGAAPAVGADGQGKPFIGDAAQLLTDIIVKGMKLKREEVYICTLVKCALGDAPEADEIAACQPHLAMQMKTIKPDVIIALGDVAAKTLTRSNEGLSALHGRWHDWQSFKVMPTFGPEYLLKNPLDKKIVWEDIKKVIAEMGKRQ